MLKSHKLRAKFPDFSMFQRTFRENSLYLNKSVLKSTFQGVKHMLREPSTQMLSPDKNPVMGDMLNGGASVCAIRNIILRIFCALNLPADREMGPHPS